MEEVSNSPMLGRLKWRDSTTVIRSKVQYLTPIVFQLFFSSRYSVGISVVVDSSLDNFLVTFVDRSVDEEENNWIVLYAS